jgi:hypothetical protein
MPNTAAQNSIALIRQVVRLQRKRAANIIYPDCVNTGDQPQNIQIDCFDKRYFGIRTGHPRRSNRMECDLEITILPVAINSFNRRTTVR